MDMNVKELYTNLKNIPSILEKTEEIVVYKNSKPSFRILPIERKKYKKYSIEDLKKIQFSGTCESKLSLNMDKYIY